MKELLICFTHHKCASRWIFSIFRDLIDYLGLTYVHEDNFGQMPQSHGNNNSIKYVDAFLHGNGSKEIIEKLKSANIQYKGIHIIRDPRDIVVSGYFSHRYNHNRRDWLKSHAEKLDIVNEKEGLLLEVDHCKINIDLIKGWDYHDPNIIEIKYEEITKNTFNVLLAVLNFLDLQVIDAMDPWSDPQKSYHLQREVIGINR